MTAVTNPVQTRFDKVVFPVWAFYRTISNLVSSFPQNALQETMWGRQRCGWPQRQGYINSSLHEEPGQLEWEQRWRGEWESLLNHAEESRFQSSYLEAVSQHTVSHLNSAHSCTAVWVVSEFTESFIQMKLYKGSVPQTTWALSPITEKTQWETLEEDWNIFIENNMQFA